MGLFLRSKSAVMGAISGAKTGWILNDESMYRNSYEKRFEQYYIQEEAYLGRWGVDTAKWKSYFAERDLHEKTFPALNPQGRTVEFWESHTYKGNITEDGLPAPDGSPSAIPIQDASKEVRVALKQLFDWSNWQTQQNICVRYGSLYGDVLVEVVDQPEKGKVLLQVVEPKYITDMSVNEVGELTAYIKQFAAYDSITETRYVYKIIFTLDTVSTFKDDKPHGYDGLPASYPNIYGFIPAVWIKHGDPGIGKFPGIPAISMGTWRKIEELNSDYTRIRMYIRKLALLPQILAGMGIIDTPETEVDGENLDIEDMMILRASQNGGVYKLEGNLSIMEALKSLEELKKEIEEDLPELSIYSNMSQQSQTTGNATGNILGPVISKIERVRTNYDSALSKVFKMAIAIAGLRYKEGLEGWSKKSLAQGKFSTFTLEDYEDGNIQFLIGKRDTLHRTELQRAQADTQQAIAIAAYLRADMPLKWILKRAGITEKEFEDIQADWIEEQKLKNKLEIEKEQTIFELQNKFTNNQNNSTATNTTEGRTLSNPKVANASQARSISGKVVNGQGTG